MKTPKKGAPPAARILVGEIYLDAGAGRLVRVIDARPGAHEIVVESLDAPAGERWRCEADRLAPAPRDAERCAQFATIPRRLLTRGERLAAEGDHLGAAGAFASAALALEALAGELRAARGTTTQPTGKDRGGRHDPE
jgi:hypothetical protein